MFQPWIHRQEKSYILRIHSYFYSCTILVSRRLVECCITIVDFVHFNNLFPIQNFIYIYIIGSISRFIFGKKFVNLVKGLSTTLMWRYCTIQNVCVLKWLHMIIYSSLCQEYVVLCIYIYHRSIGDDSR